MTHRPRPKTPKPRVVKTVGHICINAKGLNVHPLYVRLNPSAADFRSMSKPEIIIRANVKENDRMIVLISGHTDIPIRFDRTQKEQGLSRR